MKNREIATERVVSIVTFAYVFVVLCMNFHLLSKGYISTSLIPYSDFVIVFAHSLVSIGTFVNIFKPNRKLQFAYFQLESVIAILSSYEILGIGKDDGKDISLVKVKLDTGRHHQIRVQMANMACPIWGDAKYNTAAVQDRRFRQIALCAYKLEFIHPKTKKSMEFEIKPQGEGFTKIILES
jgi:hypothetical protein